MQTRSKQNGNEANKVSLDWSMLEPTETKRPTVDVHRARLCDICVPGQGMVKASIRLRLSHVLCMAPVTHGRAHRGLLPRECVFTCRSVVQTTYRHCASPKHENRCGLNEVAWRLGHWRLSHNKSRSLACHCDWVNLAGSQGPF